VNNALELVLGEIDAPHTGLGPRERSRFRMIFDPECKIRTDLVMSGLQRGRISLGRDRRTVRIRH
jgi:hypothetical protein